MNNGRGQYPYLFVIQKYIDRVWCPYFLSREKADRESSQRSKRPKEVRILDIASCQSRSTRWKVTIQCSQANASSASHVAQRCIGSSLSDDVTGFSSGDAVYSMVCFPSGLVGGRKAYAEHVSVPASKVALKPADIDHAHASAAPIVPCRYSPRGST